MQPVVIGISHATAPLELRERVVALQPGPERARAGRVTECVVLSTCNRLEVYGRLRRDTDAGVLLPALTGEDARVLRPHLYEHRRQDAVRHLFRVAAGADAMVFGEVQVLGQVRRAWQAAQVAGTCGPVLSRMFHTAVALAKRIHSETPLGRNPGSVSYAAVRYAREVIGPLEHKRVLVIGTGKQGGGVVRCLAEHGARAVVVIGRDAARSWELAQRHGAAVAAWSELRDRTTAADIVIACTSAPHVVLERAVVDAALEARGGRRLVILDLAVPRDVEPSVAHLPGVHLYNIDDLRDVVRATVEERRRLLPQIESLIEREVMHFDEWLHARAAAPAIQHLKRSADDIVRGETARALARLPALTPRERAIIEALAARVAGKVLHEPIQWLKGQPPEVVPAPFGVPYPPRRTESA